MLIPENIKELAISGVSCRLPKSGNIAEFKENLMNSVDMVTEDDRRFKAGINGIPKRFGKVPNIDKFDSFFFNISGKQAAVMDPQLRMLLECTYEAIIDSGTDPNELYGKSVGVFIGCSASEAHQKLTREKDLIIGPEMTGCTLSMFANRISYFFNFTGPSYIQDTACSSSLTAFDNALLAIRNGRCDAAIIGGSNLIIDPAATIQFNKLGMVSEFGACKAFDSSAAGYCRSEGIVSIFVQKTKDANRIYAHPIGCMSNMDGYKEEGISYPSSAQQLKLIQTLYNKLGIESSGVGYVECHGTGTQAGDNQEIKTITNFFCADKTRNQPLLIGSTKSNMGHCEPCSGLASLCKVLVAINSGVIPANLHFNEPNPNLEGIISGKLKVVDKNVNLPQDKLICINNFGFGGANSHLVLSPSDHFNGEKADIPKNNQFLFVRAARTEEGLKKILQAAVENKNNVDMLGLMNQTADSNFKKLIYRGFITIDSERPTANEPIIKKVEAEHRPNLWFCYNGMGSQWNGMGKTLMSQSKDFYKSIKECHDILLPLGFDLIETINNCHYDNVLKSMVSNVAIQIAYTDLLINKFDIKPDAVMGHSTGETVCPYALGIQSLKETILAAYWRASVIFESLQTGLMCAAMVEFEEAKSLASKWQNDHPGHIVVASIHNALGSVTFSGKEEDMKDFIGHLNEIGKKTRFVNTSGVAFHSPLIMKASKILSNKLSTVISDKRPKPKSWYSTSVPEDQWSSLKTFDGQYHVNNFLSPVLFADVASKHIPKNACIVEIGPQPLLNSQLIKNVGQKASFIRLSIKDNESYTGLLNAIGNIFNSGVKLNIDKLLKPITFPVGPSVPFISPLLEWDHETSWNVLENRIKIHDSQNGSKDFAIDLNLETYEYLKGHVIDKKTIFPATGYLNIVRKCFVSKYHPNSNEDNVPVTMKNVKFVSATILNQDLPTTLSVSIQPITGNFEVFQSDRLVCSGIIQSLSTDQFETTMKEVNDQTAVENNQGNHIDSNFGNQAIYTELKIRGYEYNGDFAQMIQHDGRSSSLIGIGAKTDPLVPFIDMMLQTQLMTTPVRKMALPTRINQIYINPKEFFSNMVQCNSTEKSETESIQSYKCTYDKELDVIKSCGVIIKGLSITTTAKLPLNTKPMYQKSVEFPLNSCTNFKNIDQALEVVYNSVINRKLSKTLFKIYIDNKLDCIDIIESALSNIQKLKNSLKLESKILDLSANNNISDAEIVFCSKKNSILNNVVSRFEKSCFICTLNSNQVNGVEPTEDIGGNSLIKLFSFQIPSDSMSLDLIFFDKSISDDKDLNVFIVDDVANFEWVESLKTFLSEFKKEKLSICFLQKFDYGISGFAKCLMKEQDYDHIKFSFISTDNLEFIRDLKQQKPQLKQILTLIKSGSVPIIYYFNDKFSTPIHLTHDLENRVDTQKCFINASKMGDLGTLDWFQSKLDFISQKELTNLDMIECKVAYSSINFRDIMLASGKLQAEALPVDLSKVETLFGLEFSGYRLDNNERVMGFLNYEGLATYVAVKEDFIWPVPTHWSIEQAATVPVAYLTAYYSLVVRGRLKSGQTVLIHSAAGAVGQAALTICKFRKAKPYVTVGTEAKRNFLIDNFHIDPNHVLSSRSCKFEYDIKKLTNGRGVDLVLNSLSGEMLQSSVRCVARGGSFLEIGKFDLSIDSSLGMSFFLKNVTFHGILLDSLSGGENKTEWEELKQIFSTGLNSGEIKPLVLRIYESKDKEAAFRYMTKGVHIGKVLLKISDSFDSQVQISAIPKLFIPEDQYCILIGGLGSIGLETAHWMVNCGCRKLVITSRSGIRNDLQKYMVHRWKETGVQVKIVKSSLSTKQEAYDLIQNLKERDKDLNKTIFAILMLSAVLDDSLFKKASKESFSKVFAAKATPAFNLDFVTREILPDLKHFICFSSVSGGFGNIGQTNYGLSNGFLDSLVRRRKATGYSGISVQWGAVGEVGMYARLVREMGADNVEKSLGDFEAQPIDSLLSSLKSLMLGNSTDFDVISCSIPKKRTENQDSSNLDILKRLANVLGFEDETSIPKNSTLTELGLASLGLIEVKNIMDQYSDRERSTAEISKLTYGEVYEMFYSSGSETESSDLEHKNFLTDKIINCSFNLTDWTSTSIIEKVPSSIDSSLYDRIKTSFVVFCPIEGTIKKLKPLCSKLPLPVYGVNFTADSVSTSIEDNVRQALDLLEKHLVSDEKVIIVGYSYGCGPALQLTSLLKDRSYSGSLKVSDVVMIDGSHSYVKSFISYYAINIENLANVNNLKLTGFVSFLANFFTFSLYNLYLSISKKINSFKDSFIRNLIADAFNCQNEEETTQIVSAADLYTKRYAMSFNHNPDYILSNINLILFKSNVDKSRADEKHDSDFGLKKILDPLSTDFVMFKLDGSHDALVKDKSLYSQIFDKLVELVNK